MHMDIGVDDDHCLRPQIGRYHGEKGAACLACVARFHRHNDVERDAARGRNRDAFNCWKLLAHHLQKRCCERELFENVVRAGKPKFTSTPRVISRSGRRQYPPVRLLEVTEMPHTEIIMSCFAGLQIRLSQDWCYDHRWGNRLEQ